MIVQLIGVPFDGLARVVIYDPDLDADRSQASRIVKFVVDVAPHLP